MLAHHDVYRFVVKWLLQLPETFMYRLIPILISALLILGSSTAAQSNTDQQRRFSIAISGGASKGAYEAGLNWGLLKILQNVEHIDESLTGQAHSLNAASFAGASAGGINTLLSGLTWCSLPEAQGGLVNTIESNIFRDVWLIPDVNRLLPPTPDSEFYSPDDALLSRHDLLQASRTLRDRWNQPGFRAGCSIPLGVTVTRVIPETLYIGDVEVRNQRLFIPFTIRTQGDGTLRFDFDPGEFPTLRDPSMILMPREADAPPYSIDDQRIEDAVVTSAAYPGGFGRKRLQYCRLGGLGATVDGSLEGDTHINSPESGLVCPDGYELAEAEFADGGLFDNLPLGLARQLAERHIHARKNVLPATYVYLDPNRQRYELPPGEDKSACAGDNPPEACRTMDFSFLTEHRLLLGALGTARKYELYRELTSENWSLNLSQLAYELADILQTIDSRMDCQKDMPFFNTRLSCADSLRRAGTLLELAYSRVSLAITPPFSASKLDQAGIVHGCKKPGLDNAIDGEATCRINIVQFRNRLADILQSIAENNDHITVEFRQRIHKSALSMHNDRILRVTDRGAPITGTLLSDFGAFLDLKFREFDYYVGVYDAVIAATQTICSLKFFEQQQQQQFIQCRDELAENVFTVIGIESDPRGRYIFARLTQWEYGDQNTMRFAYESLPEEDRDMRIIFNGLVKTLEAGERSDAKDQGLFFTENSFFQHLNNEGFEPTPTGDGSIPLLAQIIADPSNWPSELTRRATTRFVYLEREAREIFAAREPDPALRESSHTVVMGATAFSLQSATYNYPDFAFAPSTAPDNWIWRNIIPYEIAIDLNDSDLLFTWQPTWSLSRYDLLSIRASLGLASGVIKTDTGLLQREDYGALGLGYTRRTKSATISSWGLTPTWYHQWDETAVGKQDTAGGHVHVSFFKDRLRLALGIRDLDNAEDTWFLTVGITDIPGLSYWLTR